VGIQLLVIATCNKEIATAKLQPRAIVRCLERGIAIAKIQEFATVKCPLVRVIAALLLHATAIKQAREIAKDPTVALVIVEHQKELAIATQVKFVFVLEVKPANAKNQSLALMARNSNQTYRPRFSFFYSFASFSCGGDDHENTRSWVDMKLLAKLVNVASK